MKEIRNTKGITLIALIVTIIILLILAGVTITTLIGNNGLITKAKDAKIQTEIADIKEEIEAEILGKQAENQGNALDKDLKEILEKYGVLSGEEKLVDKTLTTTKGNYQIKVSDLFNGIIASDSDNESIEKVPATLPEVLGGANSPDISGFNVENTHYVTWGTTAPYQMSELNATNTIDNEPPTGWSNYTGKQWANIVTTGGGNDCYWVWIPRYAYKVPTKPTEDSPVGETIDIVFLKGTGTTINDIIDTNKKAEIEASGGFKTEAVPGNWVIHPSFTNSGNGGFGNLTGIWVAKFEASSNSKSIHENPTAGQLEITGGVATVDVDVEGNQLTNTDLQVRVKPNVTSWRNITVSDIFTVCRNLTKPYNSLCGANNTENTNIDSHMMKNTEWGAVAYLSRSKYGKNGEVWNNPYYNYYNNATNYSSITGLCGAKTNDKDLSTIDITKTCKYNEAGGGNASTTGNVYGVYDMAGGAWEYVAGYLSEVTATSNYETLANAENKYSDKYVGTNSDGKVNYNENKAKYGDAVYETCSSGASNTGSWDAGATYFPYSNTPVFLRGGGAPDGSSAGVFSYCGNPAGPRDISTFRPVVLSSRP